MQCIVQHIHVRHSQWIAPFQYTSNACANDSPTQMLPNCWNRCDSDCRRSPAAHQRQTGSIVLSIFAINSHLDWGILMNGIWSMGCYLSKMWWDYRCRCSWPADNCTWWDFHNHSLCWNWIGLRRTAVRWRWFAVVVVALSIVRCLAETNWSRWDGMTR